MDGLEEIDKNILYLDDEIENLESFSLIFMEYFNIYTAQNAEDALKILDEEEIHVFITDQRMPKVTGLEFLKQVKPKYPNIVCMIVSGYADTEVVIKALNETGIYQYIAKPWKMEEFKMVIDNAFEKFELRTNNKQLIQDLKESNSKLEETNKKLAKKVNQLDLYIYRASHDIKGYLTRFTGLCLTAQVEFKGEDSQVNQYFKLLHKEAQNMSRTLQNHLLLNSIETREINSQETDINELVKKVLIKLNSKDGVNASDLIRVDNKLPSSNKLIIDTLFLESILFQLLHNALVFRSNSCEIVLTISNKEKNLLIKVQDNGIGIDAEVQNNIYEQFFRGTNVSMGNGLGLYIVKLAVEKLQGSIHLESSLGEGATFTIDIPNVLY